MPGSWALIACRKRFIDDKLDEALGNIDAVVILGAGMDTRAYRLARRSDIPVFEVDLAGQHRAQEGRRAARDRCDARFGSPGAAWTSSATT